MRYAANRSVAAARERFPGRLLVAADGGRFLVELRADARALHLTHQGNLDALGLDDRISTGRLYGSGVEADPLLDRCQRLADAVFDWWDGVPPALVYRARTLPGARSMAFTASSRVVAVQARPLREAHHLLVELVARHGFSVPSGWL
jgi:hypothetical protein